MIPIFSKLPVIVLGLALVANLYPFVSHAYVRQALYSGSTVPVPVSAPAPLRDVNLESAAGPVHGWAYRQGRPDAPFVLLFHGNGQNVETVRRAGVLDRLAEMGADFLIVDYPGYGRSGGVPSEAALLAAADAAVEWAREAAPRQPLVACGWSLGAAVAIQTAARHPGAIDGLVTICPWSSLEEVADHHYAPWLVDLLPLDAYDSLTSARRVRAPSLVVHGLADDVIPATHGRRLYAALAAGDKRWVEVSDAGHGGLAERSELWRAIEGFVGDVAAGRVSHSPAPVTRLAGLAEPAERTASPAALGVAAVGTGGD